MVFDPTDDQRQVIDGEKQAAFISACPGAGKTRVMVERARRVLARLQPGRGVAFLSFTNAAITELEARLRREGLLDNPAYPSFVGTFDSFVWAFLIAPFGLPDSEVKPQLVPDISERTVSPHPRAQPLPLPCFDERTGEIIPQEARKHGFDVSNKNSRQIKAYRTAAQKIRRTIRAKGQIDFEDARTLAVARLEDAPFAQRLGAALAGRFEEIIVDEAQDCNPDDLKIVEWLKEQNVRVKVICDPFQSIYGFRGGVTEHLFTFRDTFGDDGVQTLTGNFRSSGNICNAISVLRPSHEDGPFDEALGRNRDVQHPVYILSYSGSGVPDTIGLHYAEKVVEAGEDLASCPLLASTHQTAAAAVGRKAGGTQNRLVRLAECVSKFHRPASFNDMRDSLKGLHRIVLDLQGVLKDRSYAQFIVENEFSEFDWRPQMLDLLKALRFDPAKDIEAATWHKRVKEILDCRISVAGGTIGQKLKWTDDVENILKTDDTGKPKHRSIHSAKGLEFPGVCVVLSPRTAKRVLDFVEHGTPEQSAEDARKVYVGASRAERILVLAVPQSQAQRLHDMIDPTGAGVELTNI